MHIYFLHVVFHKLMCRNCILHFNFCVVLFFIESLKLQRNLDNYAFLRSSRVHNLESLDDKQDFQVTRVSISSFLSFKFFVILHYNTCNIKAPMKQIIT
jgi:hypothetical protein